MIPSITIGLIVVVIIAITGEIENYKERKRKKSIWEVYSGQTI